MSKAIAHSATWHEIMQQPALWRQWALPLAEHATEIRGWIQQKKFRDIWLCGAGTSAFIGEIVACGAPLSHGVLRPVATTDFVSCPYHYIHDSSDILVVQFGRSGNSSESIAMLDLLDATMPKAHRLHITCNAAGTLARRPAPVSGNSRLIVLPEKSCDRGFAMTSSFSTMLLTALACFAADFEATHILPRLAQDGATLLEKIAASPMPPCPPRVIFLGSGALKAAAREAALKVLELTAGRVASFWDCPLGFRHGPKSAICAGTQVIIFTHPTAYTAQYDHDLAGELRQQFDDIDVVTLGAEGSDIYVPPHTDARISSVLYMLVAQCWAVQWSASLGLNMDNPFADGSLSRVVEHVRIHSWLSP